VSDDAPPTREQLLAARYFYRDLAEARLKRIEELEAEVAQLTAKNVVGQAEPAPSADEGLLVWVAPDPASEPDQGAAGAQGDPPQQEEPGSGPATARAPHD
jgi:hypothetical protein